MPITAASVAYDYFGGTLQTVDAAHPLAGTLSKDHDWKYFVVAPIGPSKMALIGDTGLFITRGKQRIESLVDDGKILDGKTLVAVQLYARLRAKKKRAK